jgi:hypothetical protein
MRSSLPLSLSYLRSGELKVKPPSILKVKNIPTTCTQTENKDIQKRLYVESHLFVKQATKSARRTPPHPILSPYFTMKQVLASV